MRYSSPTTTYSVHCVFLSNFTSPQFLASQSLKPDLTKRREGTNEPIDELAKKVPTAKKVAEGIIRAVERGDFALCDDPLESSLLFANMIRSSPKRGLGVVDSVLSIVMGLFVWPVVRRRWESMCRQDSDRQYNSAQTTRCR
jgi:3-dehydrosphinganine reductase